MRRILHIIDSLDDTDAAYQLRVLANGLPREAFEQQIATLDARKFPLPQGDGSSNTSQTPITSLAR